MNKFYIVLLLVFVSIVNSGVTLAEDRATFVGKAFNRLDSAKITNESKQPIIVALKKWEKNKNNDEAWISLTDAIKKNAKIYSVKSTVEFKTQPSDGATIKYQSIGEHKRREPPFSAGTSNCKQILDIGYYVIWAERDDIITAKFDNYRIINGSELVILNEKKEY
jgi:hypothetical protein